MHVNASVEKLLSLCRSGVEFNKHVQGVSTVTRTVGNMTGHTGHALDGREIDSVTIHKSTCNDLNHHKCWNNHVKIWDCVGICINLHVITFSYYQEILVDPPVIIQILYR